MAKKTAEEVYLKLKGGTRSVYDETIHCPMIINILTNPNLGTVSAFCVEAEIGDSTFYNWVEKYPVFSECYHYGRMVAKSNWEKEGEKLNGLEHGEVGCKYELWRLKGWSQFGIGKNSRIRLNVRENGTPAEHYHDLLKQANSGDFTAGEIKQLMEAVNVGLNAHQAFEMQKQIDSLKVDLEKMESRSNG